MYSLGRVQEHDPRSRGFVADLAPDLRNVTHRHWGPTLDQLKIRACTGNAIAQALNTSPLRHGRRLLTEVDALSLYGTATALDEFPGIYPDEDTGSSGLAVAKAAQQAGYITSYRHAFGLDQCLAALALSPVIIGTEWHQSMFRPVDGYLRPSGDVVGGHEYTLLGLDVGLRRVTMLNSWGPGWGRNGRAYITWDDLGALLDAQGDVTVPVP